MPTLPPASVSVSNPITRKITDFAVYPGRTKAVVSVDVRAKVWGYLVKINFTEGAMVKKDDVLFEIDPRPYQALLDQAKADLESKKALAFKTEAVYRRSEKLVSSGAASKEDLTNNQGDWLVAKANIGVSQAALDTAELNLGYTKVKAEIAGRVSKYNVTLGNMVQSGDQAGGTLLTTIVSIDPMYAEFDVDERRVLQVRELVREGKARSARDPNYNYPIYLQLANETGFPHTGRINFVDNQVNPSTGTLLLRGVFDNKDEALVPGLFVRARIPIGEAYDALLVTDRAIDTDQGQKILYVVNEKNEVLVRPVEVGALQEGFRVILKGISPSDLVVVDGLQQIRPGAVVNPTKIDMPTNPAFAKLKN